MIIAQISDTHIALDTPDSEQRIRDFEKTIADLNALDPLPDVILHTGDVVHNGRQDEYAEAVRILASARAPVYVIPGNKDERANLRAAFSSRGDLPADSAFIQYAVEDFPVRLIAVDTKSATSNKGDFCQERARRLVELIDADTTKPIAAFTHHPPFEVPVGPDPINFETSKIMQRLRRTLKHSERIAAVFSGHVHRGTAGYLDGIPATVMPSIATTLRMGSYPAYMDRRPIYHLHRFDSVLGFSTASRIVGK
jgi:3',5'-cyclic-AMP phosphodiesterase